MLGGVSTDTLPIDYCCVHHGLHGGGAAGRINANTTYLTTADRPRKRTYVRTYMLSRKRLSDTHSLFLISVHTPKEEDTPASRPPSRASPLAAPGTRPWPSRTLPGRPARSPLGAASPASPRRSRRSRPARAGSSRGGRRRRRCALLNIYKKKKVSMMYVCIYEMYPMNRSCVCARADRTRVRGKN